MKHPHAIHLIALLPYEAIYSSWSIYESFLLPSLVRGKWPGDTHLANKLSSNLIHTFWQINTQFSEYDVYQCTVRDQVIHI